MSEEASAKPNLLRIIRWILFVPASILVAWASSGMMSIFKVLLTSFLGNQYFFKNPGYLLEQVSSAQNIGDVVSRFVVPFVFVCAIAIVIPRKKFIAALVAAGVIVIPLFGLVVFDTLDLLWSSGSQVFESYKNDSISLRAYANVELFRLNICIGALTAMAIVGVFSWIRKRRKGHASSAQSTPAR